MYDIKALVRRISKKYIILTISILIWPLISVSQTGPGGIGNTDGSSPLTIWLQSDKNISYNTNNKVIQWADNSGYDFHFSGSASMPNYLQNAKNGLPAIGFEDSQMGLELLSADLDNILSEETNTLIFVKQSNSGTTWFNPVNTNLRFDLNSSDFTEFQYGSGSVGGATDVTSYHIVTGLKTNSNQRIYVDGQRDANSSNSASLTLGTEDIYLGTQDGSGTNGWQGQIAEVLVYNRSLDTTERLIVDNYLSAKFDLSLPQSNYDKYQGDQSSNGDFDFDVVGIGNISGNKHVESNSSGVRISDPDNTLNDGEFVFIGHDNTYNQVSTSQIESGIEARWSRNWYVDTTGVDGIDMRISFDMSEGIGGSQPGDVSNYVLLYRGDTTVDFSQLKIGDGINGDRIYFDVENTDLKEGYYTLGTTDKSDSPVGGGQTWYSYYQGKWDEWSHWTLNPDGSILKNPNRHVPGAADTVVILNGTEIHVENSKKVGAVEMRQGGVLDLAGITGHDMGTITGAGKIQIASGQFPAGDASDFADRGIVEFNGGTNTTSLPGALNDVIVNLDDPANNLILMDDLTIQGHLNIDQGQLQINDSNSSTPLEITVRGDVEVKDGGAFTVGEHTTIDDETGGNYTDYNALGTGDLGFYKSHHVLNCYGDIVNEGTISFTNEDQPDYRDLSNKGAVTLFMKGASNNKMKLNGTTDLYNLVVDKGSDKTYQLRVVSSDVSNFRLFGVNAAGYGSDSDPFSQENPELRKALWIRNGTLRLQGNIFIPTLTEDHGGGNSRDYFIPANGQLWMDGPGVKVYSTANASTDISVGGVSGDHVSDFGAAESFSIYGTFRITDGNLHTHSHGFVYWPENNAEIIIEGGYVNSPGMREAGSAPEAGKASYLQSGGTVYLRGNDNESTGLEGTATFSFNRPQHVFNMSGGLLEIVDGNSTQVFNVGAAEGNYSATGGTVRIVNDGNLAGDDYGFESTSPVYNLELENRNGGSLGLNVESEIQVANNLVIDDNSTLSMNGNDLLVAGDFLMRDGGTYDHGNNITTFNGEKNSLITLENGQSMDVYDLVVDKSSSDYQIHFSTSSNTAAQINNNLRVEKGVLDYSDHQVKVTNDVYVADTLGRPSTDGRLVLNGTNVQTIETSTLGNPYIGHAELASTHSDGDVGAQLNGDAYFGQFTLSGGIMDIGKYLMSVNDDEILPSNNFGIGRKIMTNSESGAKGLQLSFTVEAMDYSGTNTRLAYYPIGVSGRYTPMEVVANDNNITGGNGKLAVAPVDEVHPAVAPGFFGEALDYYWRANSKFDEVSNGVIDYIFYYDDQSGDFHRGYRYFNGTWNEFNWEFSDDVFLFNDMEGVVKADFTTLDFLDGMLISAETFTSDTDGSWNTESTWTRAGEALGYVSYPRIIDVVIIQSQHTVNTTIASDAVAGDVTVNGRLIINSDNTSSDELSRVSGSGTIQMNSQYLPLYTNFDDFMNNDAAVFEYSAGGYGIPNSQDFYPTLKITGSQTKTLPNTNVLVQQDLEIGDSPDPVTLAMGDGDVMVEDSLLLSNAGELVFPSTQHTVQVYESIVMQDAGDAIIAASGGSGPSHLVVEDDVLVGPGSLQLQGGPGVDLTFTGDSISTLSSDGGSAADVNLNNLIIDKNNPDDTVYINTPLNITSIELNQGVLVLNHPDIDITLNASGGDFTISDATSLILRQGATARVNGDGNGLVLDSRLRIEDDSRLLMEDQNYIEYSASGSAIIEVLDNATLKVGSQIRRGEVATTGILKYRQTGGSVTIGHTGGMIGSRGVFEVLNAGSEFTHTGGELVVSQGQPDASVAAVLLDPTTNNISGDATLQLGDGNTNGGVIGLNAAKPLSNLLISNASGNNPTVRLMVNDLSLSGDLETEGGAIFDANDLNLTLAGDMINSGNYQPGTNRTRFDGQQQLIEGETVFHDLKVQSSDKLSLSGSVPTPVSILNGLTIESSILEDNGNAITVNGDIHNTGDHISSGSAGGMILEGDQATEISGGGTFGRMELNNPEGASLTQAITIEDQLRLTNGVFRINEYRLRLNGTLKGSDFGENKMISTSGAASNGGLQYEISTDATGLHHIPVGVPLQYAPVDLDVLDNPSASHLTFKPVMDPHPTIMATDSVLQFYWKLEASNASDMDANLTFHYHQNDVPTPYGSVELDYIPAHLYEADWGKYNPANVNTFENEIMFGNTDISNLSGEYTAGLDGAIPDDVPVFTTVKDGDWDEQNIWRKDGLNPGEDVPADGPNGFIVNIEHNVTVPLTPEYFSINPYETRLKSTGRLDLLDTYGHYLGEVSGEGTLALGIGKLPGGEYDQFFTCSGGVLEYEGSDSYTISDVHDTLRVLRFKGTGTKTLPLNNLVICDSLVIDGPTLDNHTWDNQLTLLGTFARYNGTYNAGDASDSRVIFSGSEQQKISTPFTGNNAFYNFTLDNTNGLIMGDETEISNELTLENGIMHTGDTSVVYLSNTSENVVNGVTSNKYVSGPVAKQIISSGSYEYPVGDQGDTGPVQVINTSSSGAQKWEARYVAGNPADDGYDPNATADPLSTVSQEEYWIVQGPGAGSEALVKIPWDSESQISSLVSDPSKLHLAEWGGSQWIDVGNTVDEGNQTVQSDDKRTLEEHAYTFGSNEYVKPTVDLEALQGNICQGEPATLRFELTGKSPWELTYQDPNGDETTLTINNTPYDVGNITLAGTYEVTKLVDDNSIEGDDLGNPVTINQGDEPLAFNVTGDGSICSGETTTIGLDGSEADTEYELYRDNTLVQTIMGDDGPLEFGPYSTEGNYSVVAVSTHGCTTTMNNEVTIDVTSIPDFTPTIEYDNPACYQDDLSVPFQSNYSGTADSYTWTQLGDIEGDLTSPTDPGTDFQPAGNPTTASDTTWFNIEITNNGCTGVDSLRMILLHRPVTGNQYHVPNNFDQN